MKTINSEELNAMNDECIEKELTGKEIEVTLNDGSTLTKCKVLPFNACIVGGGIADILCLEHREEINFNDIQSIKIL